MGNAPVLSANQYVDPYCSGYCTVISNQAQMGFQHTHNYYEIFLVLEGQAVHLANTVAAPLQKGSMVLLRPEDEHCYLPPMSPDFRFLNLIVTEEVIQKVVGFLGEGFDSVLSSTGEYPRHCEITGNEFDRVLESLNTLMLFPKGDLDRYNTLFRITALDVLSCFFHQTMLSDHLDYPEWLRFLVLEMQKKENYARGLPAMYEISKYTPEHLCRAFRKYLDTSPTRFLNAIRLDEAALRLIYTGDEIIDIAMDIGFDNLSHFYHLFKQRHEMSPLRYRKLSHNSPQPKAIF